MTVQVAPPPGAESGNRLPKAAAKAQKQQEALARKEILAPVSGMLTVASLIVALASVCSVVPFILIVAACRELLNSPVDTDRVWSLFGAAVLVLVVRAFLQVVALSWSHAVDAGYQLTLRRLLAAKLTRVPLGWFGERSSGEVKGYLRDDVDALHFLVAHARLDFIGALVVPLVTLGYLFTVDWRLTLVLIIPLVAYFVLFGKIMDRDGRDRVAVYTRWERRLTAATIEFVDGIQVVRAFGQAGKAHKEFQDAVEGQVQAAHRMKTPIIRVQAASDIVVMPVFVMLVVVLGGLAGVGLGWVDPLDLLPFLLVGLGIGSSLLGLGYGSQALRAGGAAALRLHELLQTPELEIAETPAGVRTGIVAFEGVEFAYRTGHDVLRGIDLELTPGTITALVGPSGSGKSTLAKLLPRFYDVGAGRITIDGRDIREFTSEELYRTVGFVFQDVRLIRGSIRENL
ncbi:ABC transporter transmembrane domain-containing protein, partial [Nocardia salmonicida]|uniref:ABC transporter transmembrane domain-containing protein n=1 Tax=Nocardia salmonicida TaxID=53431 RepID=UPI00364CE49D